MKVRTKPPNYRVPRLGPNIEILEIVHQLIQLRIIQVI